MRFLVILEIGNEETVYGVVFAGLPGCFSAWDLFEEAKNNTKEAAELWQEEQIDFGETKPKPRD